MAMICDQTLGCASDGVSRFEIRAEWSTAAGTDLNWGKRFTAGVSQLGPNRSPLVNTA